MPDIDDKTRVRLATMAENSINGQNIGDDIDNLVADLYGINLNIALDVLSGYE